MITGIDLVREMISIAGGEPLRYQQSDVRLSGHAIEVRINAEDGSHDFRPSPGKVTALQIPGGMGTRFDSLLYAGYTVLPFYDSLLGKLIVWDTSRETALHRLRRALGELKIDGIVTTAPLLRRLVEAPEVRAGVFHTRWLEQWLMTTKPQDAMMEQSIR
jgi:acetyl-CoA carboxylase biotin carboxylase subunit